MKKKEKITIMFGFMICSVAMMIRASRTENAMDYAALGFSCLGILTSGYYLIKESREVADNRDYELLPLNCK